MRGTAGVEQVEEKEESCYYMRCEGFTKCDCVCVAGS